MTYCILHTATAKSFSRETSQTSNSVIHITRSREDKKSPHDRTVEFNNTILTIKAVTVTLWWITTINKSIWL